VNEACATGDERRSTHYNLGTAYGAHPYPVMVRNFQRIIGDEARRQFGEEERLPDCSSPASAAAQTPSVCSFRSSKRGVKMLGVEAGGEGIKPEKHARVFKAFVGVLQGTQSYILRTSSVRFSSRTAFRRDWTTRVGPEQLVADEKRVDYTYPPTSRRSPLHEAGPVEGIIPALESAHAVAHS